MHDIWEPELQNKIHRFLDRKSRKFPELRLENQWEKHEYPSGRAKLTRQPMRLTTT